MATKGDVMGAFLDQCSLSFKDGKSFLESSDLSFTSFLAFLIWFRLRNTLLLNLLPIIENSIKLCLQTLTICSMLCNCFVKRLCFLGLVFHILFFGCLCNLV